jgi:hypothetical protein
MSANVLFQYPTNAIATNADVVVTSGKIRCNGRVFDTANVSSTKVSWTPAIGRFAAIVWVPLAIGLGVTLIANAAGINQTLMGIVLFVIVLGLPAFLIYRVVTRGRWGYWNVIVFMNETEEVIMSGDSSNRVCGLHRVDRQAAQDFAKAVETAASESAGSPA